MVPWWTRDMLFHATLRVQMDLLVGSLDGSLFLARRTANRSLKKSSDFLRRLGITEFPRREGYFSSRRFSCVKKIGEVFPPGN